MKEILSRHRKLCRKKVGKLKRKMLVVTKKIMSRQFPEAEVHKELDTTILCRDTRHSCHDKNETAGSKLCRDIIKICHDIIQEKSQRTGRDKKLQATTEATTKTKDSIARERQIWARKLGIHNTILKCGPTLESL